MPVKVMLESKFPNLQLVKKGKVRDIYDLGEYYLLVSTDRLSAFDVIMNQGIPHKGAILNRISEFWFNRIKHIVPNHIITTDVYEYPSQCFEYLDDLANRSMVVKKGNVIPLECIVRGYLSGTGWNEYKETGAINGIKLPHGLSESDKLPEVIFTPTTKAEIGEHDENITFEMACEKFGTSLVELLRDTAIKIFSECSAYALEKGIIIADTKFEFALDNAGNLLLVDEVLTPDSSRFWSLNDYSPGKAQLSYDKQFVRDYLLSIGFKKTPPAPDLPEEVIAKTSEKYLEAYTILTEKVLF